MTVISAWTISALFEALGGRAALAGNDTRKLGVRLTEVFAGLTNVLSWTHKMSILLCAVLVLSVVVLLILGKKKNRKVTVLLPLLLIILLTYVNTNLHTFRESNYLHVSGKLCMEISRDLVNQVIEADREGKTEIELEV